MRDSSLRSSPLGPSLCPSYRRSQYPSRHSDDFFSPTFECSTLDREAPTAIIGSMTIYTVGVTVVFLVILGVITFNAYVCAKLISKTKEPE